MSRTCRIILAVFCWLALLAIPAIACTCAPGREVMNMRDKAVRQRDASNIIFEGRVEKQEITSGPIGPPEAALSITGYGAHRVVTIRTSRVYRGPTQAIFTVVTGMAGGDCGFDFETAKEFLVYAEPIGGGKYFTSICSGTAPVEQAAPALHLLRGEPPTADDLLDVESYYKKFVPRWTATVCGRVLKADGTPLASADVEMKEIRDEPFPQKSLSDENLGKEDGTFCIRNIPPGRYLLTAEAYNFDENTRWMGFYPGVTKHGEAKPIEVKAGDNISGIEFRSHYESLYSVRFRVVTSDGSPLPWEHLGIAIDNHDRDALAYHESHGVEQDGTYTLGLIPPGQYTVSSYMEPNWESGQLSPEASKWRMAKREVDVTGNTEVVLTLTRTE